MHLLLLILYGSFLLVSPNLRQVMDDWNREGWQQPVVHWQLVLLMIWSAGIFLDEQQQIFKKQEMASHGFENDGQIFKMPTMVKALSSPFERFIDIGQRLLFISCTLRLMSLYSPDSISGAVLYAASLYTLPALLPARLALGQAGPLTPLWATRSASGGSSISMSS